MALIRLGDPEAAVDAPERLALCPVCWAWYLAGHKGWVAHRFLFGHYPSAVNR